jgi:hypothetical protein
VDLTTTPPNEFRDDLVSIEWDVAGQDRRQDSDDDVDERLYCIVDDADDSPEEATEQAVGGSHSLDGFGFRCGGEIGAADDEKRDAQEEGGGELASTQHRGRPLLGGAHFS